VTEYPPPRHLICALGPDLDTLVAAARSFAAGTPFSVDTDYSVDEADDRMVDSFGVCWDRVHPRAWTDADEQAVADHAAVMYALSPSLEQHQTVAASLDAIRFAAHLLEHGATAVKAESAGVAHGAARWRELARSIGGASERARARIARIAVTKRPLGGDRYYESVGHHLVGLPEVYVAKATGLTDRGAVAILDAVADELAADGIDAVVARHGARLERTSPYEDGFTFKINPYGIIELPARSPIVPSRPGL
jgi:hypothetical protein